MRLLRRLAAKAFVAATILPIVTANPYPRLASESPAFEIANSLALRACAVPCGYYGQLCCQAGETCYTDSNNQAQCGSGKQAGSGGYQLFTTTYVVSEVETITTVWSAPVAAASPNVVTVTATVAGSGGGGTPTSCNYQLGQVACGSICCSQGQFCNNPGQCVNNGATTPGPAGGSITAAIRPTSISTYTVITTGGVTTTVPFLAPASATGNVTATTTGSSLSGGAIAGIVIGVLAGIVILILLIICCCARGLLDLFRPKRKTEVTEIYESRHHGSGSAAGPPPRRRFPFFGGGGGRQQEEKKGWLGVAGVLAAMAVILGLKRRRDRRKEDEKSTAYTYSDYTYDYSTSASSASSDRRTRASRSDRRSSRR